MPTRSNAKRAKDRIRKRRQRELANPGSLDRSLTSELERLLELAELRKAIAIARK